MDENHVEMTYYPHIEGILAKGLYPQDRALLARYPRYGCWLACRLLTAVCVWANIWIFFWVPATLFFLRQLIDEFSLYLDIWPDWMKGPYFPLIMTFFPGFAYIPGIHWTVTCQCLLLSVVPAHASDPLAVDPWPQVSSTAPLPQVTSTQHRWDCLQTLTIHHGCVPPPGQAGSEDSALTHGWTLSTAQCV